MPTTCDSANLELELLRLLWIESADPLSDLTARYLTNHGTVVTVERGIPSVKRYDCIVVDDPRTCRALRAVTDVPILVLGDAPDRATAMSAGADDHRSRLVSSSDLLACIRALVQHARESSWIPRSTRAEGP